MKIKILKLIYLLAIGMGLNSCVEFLDQVPDAQNFNEEQVFSDYEKSQQFIDQLLIPFHYFDDNDWGGAISNGNAFYYGYLGGKSMYGLRERITDNCLTAFSTWHTLNSWRNGQMSGSDGHYFAEGSAQRFQTMWKAIRVANMSIANVGKIQNVTPEQEAKILGLAYFLRGHFYFQLLQGWGGMPYITEPLSATQDLSNFPRLSYRETAQKIAEDFQKASEYLPLAVENSDWNRPSKIAAVSYKAKALVWAASPFSNPGSDATLWANAAVATGEAIQMAEANGYRLVTLSEFKNMFCNVTQESLRELIFGRMFPSANTNGAPYYCGIRSTAFGNSWQGAGESSTENLASTFTWANGEPVDPNSAEYQSNPFYGDPAGTHNKGRDPRFYETLLFNGARTPQVAALTRDVRMWNKSSYTGGAQTVGGILYPGGNSVGEELTYNSQGVVDSRSSMTGYYNWKLFAPAWGSSPQGRSNLCTNYIRMADLYLYYAECANRAWGYNAAPQGIAGFTLTALQSLNKVRGRQFGSVSGATTGILTGINATRVATDPIMPAYDDASPDEWLRVGSPDRFDQLVRNETRVENAFEEKRLYDLRRWRICTDQNVLIMKSLYVERTAVNKFKYTVTILPDGDKRHLRWQDRHHLFQIPSDDTFIGKGFPQNPGW